MEKRYVVFRIHDIHLGVQLETIKEVIEMPPLTSVPRAHEYFLGVTNLRGQIVGVVDLARLLKLPSDPSARKRVLIFETEQGSLGATVDQLVSVATIADASVETTTDVPIAGDRKFFGGFSRQAGRVVVLIDLKSVLTEKQYIDVAELAKAA